MAEWSFSCAVQFCVPRFTALHRRYIFTDRKRNDSDSLYRDARFTVGNQTRGVCKAAGMDPRKSPRPGHRRALPPHTCPVCPLDSCPPHPQRWSWTPLISPPFLLFCLLQKVMYTGPSAATSEMGCLRDSPVLGVSVVRSLLLLRNAPSSGCAGSFTRSHLKRTASAPARASMNGAATHVRVQVI